MAVLFVESFSLDSGKIYFPIQIVTIMMGLSIIYFKGSPVDFPKKCVFQSLDIAFIIANSTDPDEMQQLPNYPSGIPVYKGFIPHYQVMPLGQKYKKIIFSGSTRH